MLHTLSQSPWQTDISARLRLVRKGDAVLLLSDGVLAALNGCCYLELLRAAPVTIYALQEDIKARGISAQISSSVVRVGYTDFVRLAAKHSGQLAW